MWIVWPMIWSNTNWICEYVEFQVIWADYNIDEFWMALNEKMVCILNLPFSIIRHAKLHEIFCSFLRRPMVIFRKWYPKPEFFSLFSQYSEWLTLFRFFFFKTRTRILCFKKQIFKWQNLNLLRVETPKFIEYLFILTVSIVHSRTELVTIDLYMYEPPAVVHHFWHFLLSRSLKLRRLTFQQNIWWQQIN